MQPQISIVTHSKRNVSVQLKKDIDWLSSIPEEGEVPEDRVGVWRRRRRLDGALNRAPHEFYNQVWFILEHVSVACTDGSPQYVGMHSSHTVLMVIRITYMQCTRTHGMQCTLCIHCTCTVEIIRTFSHFLS